MSLALATGVPCVPLLAIAPLLLAAAYCDLRYMRIPNLLSIAAIAAFLIFAALAPPPDLLPRLMVAAVVLALGLVGFAFRLFGGGDVKFLATLVLFVPLNRLVTFGNVFSVSLLLGVALVLALRRIPSANGWGWKGIGGPDSSASKFPMGVSIALAGLSFPWVALALG